MTIAIVIIVKATSDKNGIVTNPNQLIYWPEHGTPFVQALNSFIEGIFAVHNDMQPLTRQ